MITKLKKLWMQAFGDSPESVDGFFDTGYDQKHSAVIRLDGEPVSALYWLDYDWNGEKLAYIYAVATDEKFRGQGYGKKLMEQAHTALHEQGYNGAVLVPAEEYLVLWYEKQGYQVFYRAKKQEVPAGNAVQVSEISAKEYAKMRQEIKPDAPQPGKAVYDYFATYGGFYKTENGIFAAARQGDTVYFQEFLGEKTILSGVVSAFGAKKGIVTLEDGIAPFAMMYRFADGPMPEYFSFALD